MIKIFAIGNFIKLSQQQTLTKVLEQCISITGSVIRWFLDSLIPWLFDAWISGFLDSWIPWCMASLNNILLPKMALRCEISRESGLLDFIVFWFRIVWFHCVRIWTAFAIVGPLVLLPGQGLLCVSVSPLFDAQWKPCKSKDFVREIWFSIFSRLVK